MSLVKMRREAGNGKLIDESIRAANLFPPQAYDEERELFIMDDNTIGFVIQCEPISSMDQNTQKSVESFFQNTPFPEGSFVQINLYRSPDIKSQLADIYALRQGNNNKLFKKLINERIKFFDDHTVSRLRRNFKEKRHDQGVVFDLKLMLSVKMEISGAYPSDDEMRKAENLRIETMASLGTIGLQPRSLDAKGYIRILQTMLNWGAEASWRHGHAEYDETQSIAEQLLDYDNPIEYHKHGLKIGDYHVRTLSAKRAPRKAYFGIASDYCGDLFHGISAVKEHYMVVLSIYFPKHHKKKSDFDRNRTFVINQSQGPIVNYVPVLAEKKADFDALHNDVTDEGYKFCMMHLNVVVFCPNEKRAAEAVSDFRSYWRKNQFEVMPNTLTHHVNFFNSLPLFTDPTAMQEMQRFKTGTPKQAAVLAPIFGEWKGTGTPYINLLSRNGQIMSLSKYDSLDNYNSLTCAASGSGKSFLTNNEIDSYMSEGARVWVIDVGRSYEKLASTLGGDFIEFSDASNVCINPFPLVKDYKEEEDALVSIIRLMISYEHDIDGVQVAELKRELQEAYKQFGGKLTIDILADRLLANRDNRVKDMGTQLFPFTSNGSYGRFFNGENTVSFTNQFTVLELEELKGRPHLQQVVLAQMLYQIQQAIYLDIENRDTKKLLFIDEAWSMLTNEGIAEAIETAYRRFRKYGGSISLITQSLLDFDGTSLGETIIANANSIQLLGQKAENLTRSIEKGYLQLPDGYERMLSTVKTIPGIYSEVFIKGSYGMGIGRLFVSEYQILMYSTHPDDVAAIERYRKKGKDVGEAIELVIRDRKEQYGSAGDEK
ncbi:type IV secretion system protein TraC [Halomonas sp. I5-271120]|uniref:type IV secretion system protein TraC n=1 Tax=Halomonas sp. I5-271120 TaxID=3061632 RepID=UPI0027147473|nr:type IV secretion system protein TraC [Halomonas sp. I5-271120]